MWLLLLQLLLLLLLLRANIVTIMKLTTFVRRKTALTFRFKALRNSETQRERNTANNVMILAANSLPYTEIGEESMWSKEDHLERHLRVALRDAVVC